ncbi:MAG: formylglycine-generating enzyme family protein [Cyanobacteria bacterium J06560_2]
MIERWIEVLSDKSIDLSAAEIADACWLTIIQHRFGVDRPGKSDEREDSEETSAAASMTPLSDALDLPEVPDRTPEEVSSEPVGNIFTEPSRRDSSPDIQPVLLPTSLALRDLLPFAKALRPLMQQRPVAFQGTQLDENATVQKIAEEQVLYPVIQPLTESWLELAIVVDESDSMLLWRQTVQELTRFFKHYGVFRDVRLWGLIAKAKVSSQANSHSELLLENDESQQMADASEEIGEMYIRATPFTKGRSQDLRHPKSLLDPARRRLILLVTDCVNPLWQSSQMLSTMQLWAKSSPMAMVQMMPEWLWSRTHLRQAKRVWFQGKTEGNVNQDLIAVRSVLDKRPLARSHQRDIKLPILTIESRRWQKWAQMLADRGSHYAPGFLFHPHTQMTAMTMQQRSVATSAMAKTKTFRGGASSIAKRLASLLAASPSITLPVVRIVQDSLLPQAEQVHVAEVLLGDILQPTEALTVETDLDQVRYEFVDSEIRSLLLAEAPVTDTTKVLSDYIYRNFGRNLQEFVAWWQEGGSEDFSQEQLKPIATVAAEVLQYRGSEYTEFVQAVRDRYDTHPGDQPPSLEEVSPEDFPELSDFPFDRLSFVEGDTFPPPLETETFTLYTLDRPMQPSGSGQTLESFDIVVAMLTEVDGQWQVQRTPAQARRFTESLPEELTLEMVAIPGGRFLMGSPEDEVERDDDESPQHEVTIAPFFMGRYPVTQAQWQVVAALPQIDLDLDPSSFKGELLPVEQVSWYEAVEFCARLSAYTGREYRLPSEADWEYACRAETTTAFHFGDMITPEVANYNGSAYADGPEGETRGETTPVNHFDIANAYGLSDMHGNVSEWCQDHWHDSYEGAPSGGSAWLTENEDANRLRRGGSWLDSPEYCRSAYRYSTYPENRNNRLGFRVSCAAPRILQ